ncbi:MAG: hypothetical protein JW729_01405, partial [Bacteroidales bacterium]|nr:hypothetical protein [Bacteroidales bacterium]
MEYLYIVTIGLLFFFSLSLLIKGKKPLSEKIISIWIILLVFIEISFLLYVKSLAGRFSIFITFICDTHLAQGVLLYFYVKAFTNPFFKLIPSHLWHLLPTIVLVSFKLVMNYVFEEMECYKGGICTEEEDNIYVSLTFLYKFIVVSIYLFYSWKEALQYRDNAKTPRDQMRYGWVKQINQGVLFLLIGILLLHIGKMLFPVLFWEEVLYGNILASLFILIFLYIGNSYTYIFVSPSKKRFLNLSESFNKDNCKITENQKSWEEVFFKLETLMK